MMRGMIFIALNNEDILISHASIFFIQFFVDYITIAKNGNLILLRK